MRLVCLFLTPLLFETVTAQVFFGRIVSVEDKANTYARLSHAVLEIYD